MRAARRMFRVVGGFLTAALASAALMYAVAESLGSEDRGVAPVVARSGVER